MTIGQKIIQLRNSMGISQEKLAELLGVSRQSVSKWEMDHTIPQIDKILQIADIFSISCDELIREDMDLKRTLTSPLANKYFGTDGFRGEANIELDSMHAYKVGRFLGWYYSLQLQHGENFGRRPKIVIGKDTRRSSYMLEYAIASGIATSGADAYMLHVTTTPSVSYVTRMDGFDCGIMITASHNPFYDNGIKVINRYGEKLDDETTALIEAYLDGNLDVLGIHGDDLPLPSKDKIGSIHDHVSGRNRYIGYLISLASNSYKKLRIGLDCANGASWYIARAVFGALGAQLYVIGDEPDGLNINLNCGSTHIERLANLVKEKHLDIGFAFDGDCDRCLAVDEKGNVVDGDAIMYVCARHMKEKGKLDDTKVVTTVMSNIGLYKAFDALGIGYEKTAVGDRFVYENMRDNGHYIGGEQSGHIIFGKHANTGDGLLTAIKVMEVMLDKKESLGTLTADLVIYPQLLKNVIVDDKDGTLNDSVVKAAEAKVAADLGDDGRILLRKSGTEPLLRVMVEATTDELCEQKVNEVIDAMKNSGHLIKVK